MSRFARIGALTAAAALATAPLTLAPVAARAQAAADAVPAPAPALPLKHAPQPTTAAITAADLMTRLYIFADDSMMGREAGTLGNVKGTDYIASEVRRFGLKPAGENGTYFQTLPFKTRSIDPTSAIALGGTGAPARLVAGTDWAAASNKSVSLHDMPVVYGGTLGDSASMIAADQTAGKLVVFRFGNPRAASVLRRGFGALYPKAAAVAIFGEVLDQNRVVSRFARPQQFVDDPSKSTGQPDGPTTLIVTATAAGQMFTAPLEGLAPGTPGRPATLDLKLSIVPVPFPARNVVAILPGRDPALAGEYVAIGGHNDHIGMTARAVDHDSIRIFNHLVRPEGAEDQGKEATPEQQARVNAMLADYRKAHPGSMRADSISNGADDDGSGSVSVLEVAEKFASLKGDARPRRSILFVWHVGEEKGLLGSEYYTD
ncbi:MAG TPA: M28 family peptidase, partial [Gemmatirosa sp.]